MTFRIFLTLCFALITVPALAQIDAPVALPEPGMLGLFSASAIGALAAKKFLGRK